MSAHALLRYFETEEEKHSELCEYYFELALKLVTTFPDNSETTVAVRKLLESLDSAKRSRKF